jgi:hypothetical protein
MQNESAQENNTIIYQCQKQVTKTYILDQVDATLSFLFFLESTLKAIGSSFIECSTLTSTSASCSLVSYS